MGKERRLRLGALAAAGFVFALLCSGSVYAVSIQELISDYDVSFGDQIVAIMNPLASNECAQIYVFDASQDLQYCCVCPVSSSGLLDLSVENNLLGVDDKVERGVIEILPSQVPLQGNCAATKPPSGSGAVLQAATYQVIPVLNVNKSFSPMSATAVKTYFANVTVGSSEATKLAKSCHGTPSCSCPTEPAE